MTRTNRQYKIVDKLVSSRKGGLVVAPPGFGKTVIAINLFLQLNRPNTVVIVPSKALQKQWIGKLAKIEADNVEVIVINTASKKKIDTDLLIIDEVHHLPAPTFVKAFDNASFKKILGLTASLKRKDKREALLLTTAPIIDIVTFEECLANGWISNFKILNVGLALKGSALHAYTKADRVIQNYNDEVGKTNSWRIASSTLKKSKEVPQSEVIKAVNYMKAVGNRSKIIYNNPDKYHTFVEIAEKKHKDSKIIVFSKSISSIETLYDFLKTYQGINIDEYAIYHSKQANKLREKTLEEFDNGKIRVLLSVDAVSEGVDVPDCEIGISLSQESSPIKAIQQLGRITRLSHEKRAIYYNLYFKDTQEEVWLNSKYYFFNLKSKMKVINANKL
jgi:superfamily II DNA or RNA helicase